MRKLLLIALGVSLGGCVALSDFDPVGSAVSIQGQWTIDGSMPTESSCAALGANRVRVTFLDVQRPVPHAGLFFSCTAADDSGDVGVFDTAGRRGRGQVVAAGDWRVRLEAIDGTGNVVAIGDAADVTAELEGPPIVVPQGEFFTGTIGALFDVQGQGASLMSCEAAGLSTVHVVFDSLGGGGQIASDASVPCAAGALGTRVLPGFDYTAHLEARDEAGAVLFATASETFSVATGSRCRIGGRCQSFCGAGADCPSGEVCSGDYCALPGEVTPTLSVAP